MKCIVKEKYVKVLKNYETILVIILLVVTSITRFCNLSYSDYIGDEHKSFIETKNNQGIYDFFMSIV